MRAISVIILSLLFACSSSKEERLMEKAELHYGHGTSSLMRQDYTTALEHLLAAVRINPQSSEYHNNLGMAYFFKGEKKLAMAHIRKAIELNTKNTDAKMNLASIYITEERLDEAKELYEQVLKDLIYQHHYRTYYNLGIISLKQNKLAQAQEYFSSSIKIKDDYCPSFFQLGLILYKKNQYKKAQENFQNSYKGTCFNQPAPHYYSAMALIKLKKYDDARIKLNQIMGKFKSTEYDTKSRLKLSELDSIIEQDKIQTKKAKLNKQHFAPDF